MPLSTRDTQLLTSVYGLGRVEALAVAALFAAAEADTLSSITAAQRRGLDMLASLGVIGSQELRDMLAALADRIADTPAVTQDADVVSLLMQRLYALSRGNRADILTGLYA